MKTSHRRFFTNAQRQLILQRANFQCESCQIPLTPETFHADHRTPFSQGGVTEVHNGQALCQNCNWKKGDSTT